jgi:hypothetical protein
MTNIKIKNASFSTDAEGNIKTIEFTSKNLGRILIEALDLQNLTFTHEIPSGKRTFRLLRKDAEKIGLALLILLNQEKIL